MEQKDAIGINLDELLKSGELSRADYQYYKGLDENRIIINDDIDVDLIEGAVIPLLDMDADPEVEHINIFLTTYGGSVYYGYALVDVIEKLHTDTTITIIGVAASMGAIIAMAGHNNPHVKTVCFEHSVGLIHDGSQYLEGTAHAVKDVWKFNERYEQKTKDFILSHSSIDEDTYSKMDRVEMWMTADDMLEYGIVDEIL